MGVFAAGLDFAELEQAASVDEADEWTPVVREPPAGRRRTDFYQNHHSPEPVIGAPAAAGKPPLFRREHPATHSSHSYFR